MSNIARRATDIPVIETPRLTLRGHRLDDFSDCAAMWADPIVTRHIGGKPFSEEDTWTRLLRYAGHWLLLGFGYWAIEEKDTGSFVGELGIRRLQTRHPAIAKRCARTGLGARRDRAWQRLRHRSGSCGAHLGRSALCIGADGLHNPS